MAYNIINNNRTVFIPTTIIGRMKYIDIEKKLEEPGPSFTWYDPFHDEGSTNQASSENLIIVYSPLKSLNPSNLNSLWSNGPNYAVAPVSDGNYIYGVGYNQNTSKITIYLYDYGGNLIAQHDIESPPQSEEQKFILSLSYNRLLYIGTNKYLIDLQTIKTSLNIIKTLTGYNPPVTSDMNYFYITYGTTDTGLEIHKIDENGNVVAKNTSATSQYEVISNIVVSKDRVFYDRTLYGNSLYICALDRNTLSSIGCVDLQKKPEMTDHIIYYNGYVYVSYRNEVSSDTREARICKINASNLNIEWDVSLYSYTVSGGVVSVVQQPNLAIDKNEWLYFLSSKLYVIGPDGSSKWSTDTIYGYNFPVVMPSGKVAVMCSPDQTNTYLKIYDSSSGNEIGSVNLGSMSNPHVIVI